MRLAAFIVLAFAALAGRVEAADLAVGQNWSLKGEPGVHAVIGRIEDAYGKAIVHISVVGVPVPDGKGTVITIPHAPFSKAAF